MSIDPARHQAQLRALQDPDAPRKRPAAKACPRCQVLEEQRVVERLTVEELHQIIAAARAELARRAVVISQGLSTP